MRVLICDDDPDFLSFGEWAVKKVAPGIEVVATSTRVAALEALLGEEGFDLVLLDAYIPCAEVTLANLVEAAASHNTKVVKVVSAEIAYAEAATPSFISVIDKGDFRAVLPKIIEEARKCRP